MPRRARRRIDVESIVDRIADALAARSQDGRKDLVPLNRILATALASAAADQVHRWVKRRRPPFSRLFRGAAAGAGAAGVVAAFRALTNGGESTRDVVDDLLAGAGRGIVYTALLDPVLPGPPAVRGALVGTAEYLAAPWGGLLGSLGSLSPVDRLPVVGALLEAGDHEDDPFVAFLIYGVALGILAGDP